MLFILRIKNYLLIPNAIISAIPLPFFPSHFLPIPVPVPDPSLPILSYPFLYPLYPPTTPTYSEHTLNLINRLVYSILNRLFDICVGSLKIRNLRLVLGFSQIPEYWYNLHYWL